MDTVVAEKINQLAKSLKDLHLAASQEEAYNRAKEIILGSQGEQKTAADVVQEGLVIQDLVRAKEILAQEEKVLDELKQELERLKAQQAQKGPAGRNDA